MINNKKKLALGVIKFAHGFLYLQICFSIAFSFPAVLLAMMGEFAWLNYLISAALGSVFILGPLTLIASIYLFGHQKS